MRKHCSKTKYKILFLLLFLVISINVFARKGHLHVRGQTGYNESVLGGVNVNVYFENKKVFQMQTKSNGSFDIKLEYNSKFTIEFEKEGYVKKIFVFNTAVPPKKIKKSYKFELFVPLLDYIKGVDYSIFNIPMAIVEFREADNEFYFNEEHALKLNTMSENVEKAIEEQKLKKEKYDLEIALADKIFKGRDFIKARANYQKAHDIFPYEDYPDIRIHEIDSILLVMNIYVGDKQYNNILIKADSLLKIKEYDEAKILYENASKLKINDAYPKLKLKAIGLLNTKEFKEQRINDKYKAMITEADKLFGIRQYSKARAVYIKAVAIKPNEKYPIEKIDEIDELTKDKK